MIKRDPMDAGPYAGRGDLNALHLVALEKTSGQLETMIRCAAKVVGDRDSAKVYTNVLNARRLLGM